jgi:hypothetical protein
MNNNLLQIKIKQRLNKLASFDYDNLECWQITEAFNKAQLEWVRRQVYGYNLRKEGSEQSTGLVDDLRILMTSKSLVSSKKSGFYEALIPSDYLYYIRTDVFATKDCCKDPRRMIVYDAEESNIGVLLSTETKKPSFEWAETLGTLVGDKVRVYTNDEFDITSMDLIYYKVPREVQIAGCINPNTGNANSVDQTCEFKDDIAELILDEAASILAGDIESMNQYQREAQAVQKNT